MPKHYCDELPPQPPPISPPKIVEPEDPYDHGSQSSDLPETPAHTMEANSYGVYHVYPQGPPSYTPDELYSLQNVLDSPTFVKDVVTPEARSWWSPLGSSLEGFQESFFMPFLNVSVFRLMTWFYGGSNLKSLGELDRLVHDVILQRTSRPRTL
jgi:hypothetical protein